MLLVYGTLVGLVFSGFRAPTASRYIYLAALITLLFLVEFAGRSIPRWGMIAAGVIFVAGLTANALTYNQAGKTIREVGVENRGILTALAIAGPAASPDFSPADAVGIPPGGLPDPVRFEAGQYLEEAGRFGTPADPAKDLSGQGIFATSAADRVLLGAEGIALGPLSETSAAASNQRCQRLGPPAAPTVRVLRLPPRDSLLQLRAIGPGTGVVVEARRFSTAFEPLGTIPAGGASEIILPRDLSKVPWKIRLSANQRALVCTGVSPR